MDIEIIKQDDNKVLNRKEVEAILRFDSATPSNEEVRTQLSAKVGGDKELVVVDHIYTAFGSREAKVFAKVYKDKKSLELYETKRKTPAEKKEQPSEQLPEKSAEGEAEEAPAQEKKEEKPTGEKTEESGEEKGKEQQSGEQTETSVAEQPKTEKEGDG